MRTWSAVRIVKRALDGLEPEEAKELNCQAKRASTKPPNFYHNLILSESPPAAPSLFEEQLELMFLVAGLKKKKANLKSSKFKEIKRPVCSLQLIISSLLLLPACTLCGAGEV